MNTFPGSVQNAVDRGTGRQEPITAVLDMKNLHLMGQPGAVDAFDIKLPLTTPFLYDRRRGQLVLSITPGTYSGKVAYTDAQGIYEIPGDPTSGGAPYGRGAYIRTTPLWRLEANPGFLVTKFSFRVISARIDSITQVTKSVRVDFTADPITLGAIFLESAPTADGPYSVDKDAQLTFLEENRTRALVPISSSKRFFRIRLE